MKQIKRIIYILEDSLLVTFLAAMILLASGQIVLRNLFEIGFIWLDPLLRVMVLWTGLIGATIASRDNKHIRIDLLSRFLSKKTHLITQTFVGIFTSSVCLIIAWHGMNWISMDFADGLTSFANIPSWSLEVIIPIAFGFIGLRYLFHSINWFNMLISGQYEDTDLS